MKYPHFSTVHTKFQGHLLWEVGSLVSGFLWKSRMLGVWPIKWRCGSLQKVETPHIAYISPSLSIWPHWERLVEREDASKTARERPLKKCAFSKWRLPCLHHLFWNHIWLFHLPIASPLPFDLICALHLLTYFTFCSLLLRKCNPHCTLSTCFTLTFIWHSPSTALLLHGLNQTFDFFLLL